MKRRNFLRATLWTESMRLDIEGPHLLVISDLFITLPTDQQQTLLDRLQAHLQSRREREGASCPDTHVTQS
jgi:hypothetical protein